MSYFNEKQYHEIRDQLLKKVPQNIRSNDDLIEYLIHAYYELSQSYQELYSHLTDAIDKMEQIKIIIDS
jgi:hypothetical protein